MADDPDHVALILLRRIDERTLRMADGIGDLKVRMTAVEEALAGVTVASIAWSSGLSGSSGGPISQTLRRGWRA